MSFIPNQQDYEPILTKGKHRNISRTVKVHKDQLAEWQELKRSYQQNHRLGKIVRYIYQLGGIADQRDNLEHRLSRPGVELVYRFDTHGDVYIQGIIISGQNTVKQQTPGIYDVEFGLDDRDRKNKWLTENRQLPEPDLTEKLDGHHRIAVSGKPFENKEEAGELLSSHIINAYTMNPNTINTADNHYSLVWLNNEFSSDKSVSLVSDIIFNTARKNKTLAWLVHSKACTTFKQVMKTLPQLTKANPDLAEALQKQQVYFSNPRGNITKDELESLCKASGLTYVNTRIDPYDWRNADARKTATNNFLVTTTKIMMGGVGAFFAKPELTKYWEQINGSPGTLLAVGGIVATGLGLYITKKGDVKQYGGYLLNSGKAWNSTVGKGHLRWD